MATESNAPEARASGETIRRGEFLTVTWQKGLPAQAGINGCLVDDVLGVAAEKLHAYQQGPLACEENGDALRAIEAALSALAARRQRRREQGVLNTMQAHQTERTEDLEQDFSATGA